jgi:hypothetical protein
MAREVITQLIDDVTGERADETVTFGLNGKTFEIDLSEANAKELRASLAGYIESGRRIGGKATKPRRAKSPSQSPSQAAAPQPDRTQNQAIRDWARHNGFSIADRGRVPAAVAKAFHAAH